ncbi:hypothetical protein [Intestinibacter sp.]|uniref:hypothetical protein n=1 Tax=Intestinibacter sp. TaxID=1965304 RepID=UPI003F187D15
MDKKQKNYTNLSIAGILFLMTGYVLDKIVKIDNTTIAMACYMLSIICLLISILKMNKAKKEEKEAEAKKNDKKANNKK